MSVDMDPAGELVSASILAHELEGQGGKHPTATHHAPSSCLNCQVALVGSYCHACGQFAHVHRSLWHIVEEALHGIVHFEGKILRTLPLLIIRPGQLTRRYIDGQRTRHVAPFGLFLFCVFFLFFVTSMLDSGQPRLRAAAAPGQAATAPAQHGEAAAGRDAAGAHEIPWNDPSNIEALLAHDDFRGRYPGLARMVEHAAANPELTLYKLKGSASKLAFLLVPCALPFLWLLFAFRRDVTLYDHAVFTLYSLSFHSLWVVALVLVTPVLGSFVALISAYPAVHVFMQLRGTYALTIPATLWRTAVLLLVSAVVGVLYVALLLALNLR